MAPGYWHEVLSHGLAVPDDRPLDDLTAELTTMLGSPDPQLRDGTAYPTLSTWVDRGVYDDLLVGLGDGMAAGLTVGLGERGTDTVFRRSFSARVLGDCIDRDTEARLVTTGKVLEWGDRLTTWFLWERDLRGLIAGRGWAHALAHGADAVGQLARSPHLGAPELAVVLDVLAQRLTGPRAAVLTAGEPDRMAAAAMAVLRRNLVTLEQVEAWVEGIARAAGTRGRGEEDPHLAAADAQAFLRALHLQVSLGPRPPAVRPDLILVLVDVLRRTNPRDLGR